jgi:hypothetical protein
MGLRVKHYLAALAVLTMTVPVWAHTYKETLTTDKNMTIGGTQLKAGSSYELTADDAKKEATIVQNGKVVATVQGQWVKLPRKPQYSTYLSNGDKITEIQFSGNGQAFQVQ